MVREFLDYVISRHLGEDGDLANDLKKLRLIY